MPIVKLILWALFLLAVAGGLYLSVPNDVPEELHPQPIYMYGEERTEDDISSGATLAIDAAVLNKQSRVHLVVQFKRIVTPAEEVALESKYDIEILEYIPERAYVVGFPAQRAKRILDGLKRETPARQGVVAIRAADKLSPRLGDPADIQFPPHAIVTASGEEDRAMLIVYFFADVPKVEQEAVLVYYKADGELLAEAWQGVDSQWQVLMPAHRLGHVVTRDSVRWVEPVARPPVDDMHEAREVAGYHAQPQPSTYASVGDVSAGEGVTLAQWEKCSPRDTHPGLMTGGIYGLPTTPRPFKRVNVVYGNPNYCNLICNGYPCDYHATMVAGIYMGNGRGKPCATPSGEPGVELVNGDCRTDDFQGMAAKARARAYALHPWSYPGGSDTEFTVADLPSFKFWYMDATKHGATISQNSWGESCDIYSNLGMPFGHSYTQGSFYLSNSAHYDTVTSGRDDFGDPSRYPGRILVVASAGNYGDERGIPSLWGSVRVANSAKNVLTVGSVNTQALDRQDNWAHLHSGRGPTADGRIAPLLSAPGIKFKLPDDPYIDLSARSRAWEQLARPEPETHGIRTTYPQHDSDPHTYKAAWGTSFATPVVSGAAALLTETYRETCSADPLPMELRALLVHTAHDLQDAHSSLGDAVHSLGQAGDVEYNQACELNPSYNGLSAGYQVIPGPVYEGPDYVFGYGMVQADRARAFAAQSHFTNDEITRGYQEFKIRVEDVSDLEDGKLRVTLAWDDPPWAVNAPASPAHGLLLNDLDLELISPSGKSHRPWVLDPADPSAPAVQNAHNYGPVTAGMRDTRNTIEQIEIEVGDEQFGTWTIRVHAGQVVRPPQAFTLISRAIQPLQACGGLPASSVEHPLVMPDTWLMWWLFWLALLILVLLIIEMLRLIFWTHTSLKEWLHAIAALLLLVAVAVLIFHDKLIALGALLLLLLALSFWLGY